MTARRLTTVNRRLAAWPIIGRSFIKGIDMNITRRSFLAAVSVAGLAAPAVSGAAAPTRMEVWKSPTCGCCKDWIAHMAANGFEATVHEQGNTDMRARLRMPVQYGSCHTALIGGYVVEGHVPAKDVRRLLEEKPAAVGIAAPGMPLGSPGMDGPEYGGRRTPHDVLLVRRDGSSAVFQSYR
jgi:hypothetical protein